MGKRVKYAKTKRELNIAMSGQFLTLAMFQRLQGVEMSLQKQTMNENSPRQTGNTATLQHWQHWRKTATLQQLRKLTTLQHCTTGEKWQLLHSAALDPLSTTMRFSDQHLSVIISLIAF